jgi:hypothetical protein
LFRKSSPDNVVRRVLAVGLLTVLLSGACASDSSSMRPRADVPSVPVAGSRQSPMQLFAAGFDSAGTPLRNGATVALAQGLSAEVFLDPYPPTGGASWLDLYVTREGRAVPDAQVTIECEMAYMNHGVARPAAKHAGDGHFLFSLEHPMIGLWRNTILIRDAAQAYELPLMLTVLP